MNDTLAGASPVEQPVGRLVPERAAWVDTALDESDEAKRSRLFGAGCLQRGLCPMCIASGARGKCTLDMLGSCSTCGWTDSQPPNASAQPPLPPTTETKS